MDNSIIRDTITLAVKELLKNPNNVLFKDLLKVCEYYFGEYRVKGSHYIFKVPWSGQPWVNLQKDGKHAKPYQVKQVLAAIEKFEAIKKGGKK